MTNLRKAQRRKERPQRDTYRKNNSRDKKGETPKMEFPQEVSSGVVRQLLFRNHRWNC